MKFVKYTFFTILILLVFMQGFIVPLEASRLTWACVFTIIFIALCFLGNIRNFTKIIVKMYKFSSFKYLVYFYLWIVFCGFLFILLGKISIVKMLYFLLRFILFSAVFIVLPVVVNKFISFKSIIKIIFFSLFIAIGFGLFQYIGEVLNINIFRDIVNFFSNYKFEVDLNGMIDRISGKTRIRGFFHEPQSLAMYMCFMLPVVYSVAQDGFKLFKSPIVNKVLKFTIILLMWFMLFVAQSPVYFIFAVLTTLIYWFRLLIRNIRNIYILIVGCLFSLVLLCSIAFFDPGILKDIIENSFLARISNALIIFKNFDEFVMKEGSLAVRVAFQINQYILFLKAPITGTGIYCSKFYLYAQLLQSPVTLPGEIQEAMTFNSASAGVGGAVGSTLSLLLLETGIVGTIFYYLYLFKNIILLNKIKLFYKGLEYSFINGLMYTYAVVILFSFYNNSLENQYMYFLYGMAAMLCVVNRKRKIIKIDNRHKGDKNE